MRKSNGYNLFFSRTNNSIGRGMDRIKQIVIALIIFLLLMPLADAGGIRWYHRLNFKVPSGVNATVTGATYTGASPSGTVGQAILKGQYSSVIDNYPVVVNAGRMITTGIVGSLALNAVKLLGPVLIANLGILVWDAVLKMWVKPSELQETGDYPNCYTRPLNVIVHKNGRACVRNCSYPHGCVGAVNLQPPWTIINNMEDTKCGPCTLGGRWSVIWQSTDYVPTNPPPTPATDAEILSELTKALNANTNALSDFINNLVLHTDLGPDLLSASTPHSLTGTNSFNKTSSSTSTGPDGQTATTTTTTYNSTYNVSTNTVSVTTTTTTNITGPDNITQTTTLTQTGDNDPTTDDPPPSDPNNPDKNPTQSDMCKDHSDILACVLLGELSDNPIPEKQGPANFSKEMSATGTCPADITINLIVTTITFSWTPICDFATQIRPVFIALTWLFAGIFVFRTVSASD